MQISSSNSKSPQNNVNHAINKNSHKNIYLKMMSSEYSDYSDDRASRVQNKQIMIDKVTPQSSVYRQGEQNEY